MNSTKQKIILAAIQLFNEDGLTNVKNSDIAKVAKMSLSNVNYHFKTKQDLVYAVMNYMKVVLEEQVYGNKNFIKEGQGLEITRSFFEFEWAFRFFYLDTNNIILNYPELQSEIETQIHEAIQIIKNLNYMAIGRGLMQPEPEDMPGLYDLLAEQIWVNNHFWLAQMSIRGKKTFSIGDAMQSSLALTYPYLTEQGKKIYQAYLNKNEFVLFQNKIP